MHQSSSEKKYCRFLNGNFKSFFEQIFIEYLWAAHCPQWCGIRHGIHVLENVYSRSDNILTPHLIIQQQGEIRPINKIKENKVAFIIKLLSFVVILWPGYAQDITHTRVPWMGFFSAAQRPRLGLWMPPGAG